MSVAIPIKKKINDSIHGFIGLSAAELEIIDTRIFQRLRRIKQVSPADLVFPGATHTRFSHCIGSMYLMDQVLTHAKREGQSIVKNRTEKQKLRLVALLHDLGHYPLSHTGEKAVLRLSQKKHTDFGVDLIKLFLKKELSSYSLTDITSYIEGTKTNSLHSSLISSDLDVDKLDYLLRDAYHAGVTYGQIDIHKIIDTMSFDGNNNMVFEKGGPAVENMLVGRYHLYQVVNQHRVVTAFEQMAEIIFFQLMQKKIMPTPDELVKDADELAIISYDDNLLSYSMIKYLQNEKSDSLTELIGLYLDRKPLKVVWESSHLATQETFPKEHFAIRLLVEQPDRLEELAKRVESQIPGFKSEWLFPISLDPVSILPQSMQLFVRKKGQKNAIPIEEDTASLFNLVGKSAMHTSRLYTKPGLEKKIRPVFLDWAKSVKK